MPVDLGQAVTVTLDHTSGESIGSPFALSRETPLQTGPSDYTRHIMDTGLRLGKAQ